MPGTRLMCRWPCAAELLANGMESCRSVCLSPAVHASAASAHTFNNIKRNDKGHVSLEVTDIQSETKQRNDKRHSW